MNKKLLIIFIVILIIGSALRLYQPTFRSLWGDEAHSFYSARHLSLTELVKDSHLPIYFVLLAGWQNAFGPSEISLRSMSILIGIFTLFVYFFFARELFGEKTAFYALGLLAISPLAIMHSQEIRMYGLLLLLSILSSWSFWRWQTRSPSRLAAISYFIVTLMLALTHIFALLMPLAQIVYLIINRNKSLKNYLLPLGAMLFALPFYAFLISANLGGVMSGSADMPFAVFPWFIKIMLIFFVLTCGETVAPWDILIVIPLALIIGGLILSSIWRLKDSRINYLMILAVLPIITAACFLKPTMPKYLIISLPFFILLIAEALVRLKPPLTRWLLVLVIIAGQSIAIKNYFQLKDYHNANQQEPWRQVALLIETKKQPGDVVIGTTHFVVQRLLNYYLNIVSPAQLPIYDLETNRIDLNAIRPARLWLVTNIHDDRAFPLGYVSGYQARLVDQFNYQKIFCQGYLSYEATLVSKLPIKRHPAGTWRIEVSLYERKGSK
jgi:uncharacterized membrane protein